MPGTGTPDCVASIARTSSIRRHGTRVNAWMPAALLSISIGLTGCTSLPFVPDLPANAKSGHPVPETRKSDPGPPPTSETARHGRRLLPVIRGRPPVPADPTYIGTLDRDAATSGPESRADKDAAIDRDSWERIRDGLAFPPSMNSRVEREIDWYRKHPKYLRRVTERARPYLAYIVREVEQRGMPMEFALLPVVESAFRVRAYSRAGASGLWQFMPSTGRRYGLKQSWWYDGRRDVVASTRAALDYLTMLLEEFDDDPLLAVAAYNWGEGNVRRAMSRNRARGKPTDVWSLRLPRETRSHVSRLLAIAEIVEDPDRYGVTLDPIPDRVPFRPVAHDGQIDLGIAAALAGITLEEVRLLNPGFKRWATDPAGPHRLQLPSHTVERFRAGLAEAPTGKRMRWERHRIASGDTLGAIAGRYGTSVAALKEANRLASDLIRAGRDLLVPVPIATSEAFRHDGTMQARLGPGATEGPMETIHHVRSGDSLWRIARSHGVDMKQLAAWNDLSMTTVLRPGQRLTVYRRNGKSFNARTSAPTAEPLDASSPTSVHVVGYGDTLSAIAKRHGTTVLELAELNRINEGTILIPGQELRLMPTAYSNGTEGRESIRYRVKRGDSLWEISRRFGVSVAGLRKWNRLPKGELLMPGRELDVHLTLTPAI